MSGASRARRVVAWGTFDLGKPRVRILLQGLRENGVEVLVCHRDVWGGVEDKSQIKGLGRRLGFLLKWLAAYPSLLYRYVRLPSHDAVLVSYMGHLDVLVIWLFAKLRGVPVIWDAFLSLYDTVVQDRRLLRPCNPLARVLWCWEWLACKAATRVVLDTRAHADYFVDTFRVPHVKTAAVFVGAEPDRFPRTNLERQPEQVPSVLFYGQFIPLHGIDTIIDAAYLARDETIDWIIIGTGQEAARIRSRLNAAPLPRLRWIEWVNYEELTEHLARCTVALGIFGDTDKAARVIPNKAFQILMSGKPLVTRDSPAIRELLSSEMPGVRLVPAAQPQALLDAVRQMTVMAFSEELHADVSSKITPSAIGQSVVSVLFDD